MVAMAAKIPTLKTRAEVRGKRVGEFKATPDYMRLCLKHSTYLCLCYSITVLKYTDEKKYIAKFNMHLFSLR